MSESQRTGDVPRADDRGATDGQVPEREGSARTAGAFDIRTLIALLIGIYGVILVVVGIVNHSDEDLAKPDGVNINLWTGIAMIVVAAGFQAWAMWRPVVVPPPDELRADERDAEIGQQPGGQER